MNSQKRVLEIFFRLIKGEVLTKKQLMNDYQKQSSSIQRDIAMIENVLDEQMKSLVPKEQMTHMPDYLERPKIKREQKGIYQLDHQYLNLFEHKLTDTEILVLLNFLMASRALRNDEMNQIYRKLIMQAEDPKLVEKFTANERLHYRGVPQHELLDRIALMCKVIQKRQVIEFDYHKFGKMERLRRSPQAIYFSDLYLYVLTSNQTSKDSNILSELNKFHLDNMSNIQILSGKTRVRHSDRFEAGKLREQTNWAFLGNPITLVIDFFYDPNYVLDRFPSARIISEKEGVYRMELQVNDGYGIKMWLLSQGDMVKIISPSHVKAYVITEMQDALRRYEETDTL